MTTGQTSTASLNLTYEGPALAQGSMSARDLGPALQAISDLFDRAGALVYLEEVDVDVQVTATKQGSFDIGLTLELLRVTYSMLGSSATTAAVNLVQILMLAINILKTLRGDRSAFRQPETETTAQRASPYDAVLSSFSLELSDDLGELAVKLDASDDTTRQIALEAISVVRDRQAVQHIQRVAEPVRRNGVDRVIFRRPDGATESIEEEDLSSFESFPDEIQSVNTVVVRQWLSVVAPNLSGRRGRWRLSDGAKVNWYDIADQAFETEVRDGIRAFRAGDSLDCQVLHTQHMDSDGKLTIDYQIVNVFAHRSKHDTGTQLHF